MIFFPFLFSFLASYLLGSIPFGLIWMKLFLKKDIRTLGSQNIGATNVLRTGTKQIAALTLFCDVLKGSLAVILSFSLSGGLFEGGIWGLAGVVIGHIFPVWLNFKGGKGVATFAGGLLIWLPPAGLVAFMIWGLSFMLTRISSLSALIAFFLGPFYVAYFYPCSLSFENFSCFLSFDLFILLCALVIWRHGENIQRLLKGDEKSFKKN